MTNGRLDIHWPIVASNQTHVERAALLRPISFEMTMPLLTGRSLLQRKGKALSLNISSGGMLVLMQHPPTVEQVMKVNIPTPLPLAETPTLAEVRWVRKVPFSCEDETSFVGLKFLF